MDDAYFMKLALQEANKAFSLGEVPIGAVIISNNHVIAKGHNLTETLNDVTAHAEMQAFTAASESLGGKYLNDCTLYVTLEPCMMCAGAAYWTQIGRIVFGADDPERGFQIADRRIIHPKTEIIGGVLADQCSRILKDFFESKR